MSFYDLPVIILPRRFLSVKKKILMIDAHTGISAQKVSRAARGKLRHQGRERGSKQSSQKQFPGLPDQILAKTMMRFLGNEFEACLPIDMAGFD